MFALIMSICSKISCENEILTSIKGHNSIKNEKKWEVIKKILSI